MHKIRKKRKRNVAHFGSFVADCFCHGLLECCRVQIRCMRRQLPVIMTPEIHTAVLWAIRPLPVITDEYGRTSQ